MATHPLSIRLSGEARAALESLEAGGLSRSEAVRRALIEHARQQREDPANSDAVAIAADPQERAEARTILTFFSEERSEPG